MYNPKSLSLLSHNYREFFLYCYKAFSIGNHIDYREG